MTGWLDKATRGTYALYVHQLRRLYSIGPPLGGIAIASHSHMTKRITGISCGVTSFLAHACAISGVVMALDADLIVRQFPGSQHTTAAVHFLHTTGITQHQVSGLLQLFMKLPARM